MAIQFEREWQAFQKWDTDTNSSNKTFTVPDKREWLVQSIYAAYTTNATAGERLIEVRVLDESDNVVAQSIAGTTQAASLTYYYNYLVNGLDSIALRDSSHLTSVMPHLIIPAGYKVRIFDNKEVDPSGTGENLIVRALMLRRDVA